MPKKHQQRTAKALQGRNNPEKSTTITTGSPKKQETYEKQAREHQPTNKAAQTTHVPQQWDWTPGLTHKADSRRRLTEDREPRSGSESNATRGRKDGYVRSSREERQPQSQPEGDDYRHDLQVAQRQARATGLGDAPSASEGYTAYEIKELHHTLADMTDDELKRITLVPTGVRLEQGARYINLQHLEQGEIVARSDMLAEPDDYYVPKKETEYVLWNRLLQITNPARLDEPGQVRPGD